MISGFSAQIRTDSLRLRGPKRGKTGSADGAGWQWGYGRPFIRFGEIYRDLRYFAELKVREVGWDVGYGRQGLSELLASREITFRPSKAGESYSRFVNDSRLKDHHNGICPLQADSWLPLVRRAARDRITPHGRAYLRSPGMAVKFEIMEIINIEARTLPSASSFAPRATLCEHVCLSACRRFEAMMSGLPALRLASSLSLGRARASTALPSLLRRFETFAERVDALCRSNGEKAMQEWLDNQDVCQLLGISSRTLQTMRDNGTMPHTRIGSKMYYKPDDMKRMVTIVADREKKKTYKQIG